VNIGAGAKLSNRKITDSEIFVKDVDGNRYPTGLKKLGGMIGDETQIGCNAVLNPGTVLGKRCLVYPLVSVRGAYAHGQVIK
jgi:NDP-sugar pyrophosphorylase family protein